MLTCDQLTGDWEEAQVLTPAEDGLQSVPCTSLGMGTGAAKFFQVEILFQD